MTGRREPDGKISAYNEVKGEALNLKHSPEKQASTTWITYVPASKHCPRIGRQGLMASPRSSTGRAWKRT